MSALLNALSHWRYPEESGGEKFLEIEFVFNLEQCQNMILSTTKLQNL
jgi:hypothetical protein